MTDLPKGWEWSTLDEVTDPARPICYGILMPKENDPAGVPYVKVRDFPAGTIDVSSLQRTAPAIATKHHRSSLRFGDVLVSIRGTYGRVALVPPELAGGNITQDTARVAPVPHLLPTFVAYFLRSEPAQSYFKAVARGVAVKGVNIGDLRLLPFPLPPRTEQDRIVAAIEEHLSRLDAAEQAVRALEAKVYRFQEAAIASLFDRSWKRVPLVDVLERLSDCPHRTPTYRDDGSHPALRPRDVVKGVLDLEGAARVGPEDYAVQTARDVPAAGDVVYSRELSYGWAVVVPRDTEPCLSQGMVLMKPSLVSGEYLSTFLNSAEGRRLAHAAATGSAHPHLNLRDIKEYPVPVVDEETQDDLVQQALRVDEAASRLLASLKPALQRASMLRQAILTAAFSGRLVPQDPDSQPASVLLERLRTERAAAGPPRRTRKAK